jgi:cellulose synthase/poly-beta-1,6-N-acetylglucosamine synthase-like glycosyltransferase
VIREVVVGAWGGVTAAAACVTIPGSFELLGLSLAAIFPVKPVPFAGGAAAWRVAVVVPAHNEEAGIAACVESLLQADHGGMPVAVYVIADNCTDNTAAIARSAGAHVLERRNESKRGKGHALHFAFTELAAIGYDCVLVVDADTIVAPNFIVAVAGAMRGGSAAVQVRYVARNAEDSTRTRLMALALRAFNVVRPRGRQNLRLSAGILGNGFGLRHDTLAVVPYLAASVVEDLEYHIHLVRSGRRVRFVDETAVFGEMPVRGKGVETQRSRWEGGRLRMLREKGPELVKDLLVGRWRCLELLLELLLLPLAFHVMLLVVAICSPLPLVRDVAIAGFAVVCVHLGVTIVVGRGGWCDLATLATAPFYIVWKLLLIPKLLRHAKKDHAWVRTSRNSEGDVE